ncbi:hypothetical protein D3C86_1104450 [compost metagenome]
MASRSACAACPNGPSADVVGGGFFPVALYGGADCWRLAVVGVMDMRRGSAGRRVAGGVVTAALCLADRVRSRHRVAWTGEGRYSIHAAHLDGHWRRSALCMRGGWFFAIPSRAGVFATGRRSARRGPAQRPFRAAPVLRPHGVSWRVDLVAATRPRLGQPAPAQPVRHLDQHGAGRCAVVVRHAQIAARPQAACARCCAPGRSLGGLRVTHRRAATGSDRCRGWCHGLAGAPNDGAARGGLSPASPRASARRHPAVRRPALADAVPGQRR